MVEFNSLQPKFRSRFKKLISSRRSHTTGNQRQENQNKTLAQLSNKTISEQKNKIIHNMSKQSYITNKKQFLLSRKLFYKPKPEDTKLLQIENMMKFNKINVQEDLMDNSIQQEDIFSIHKQILNNPINFHKNMIIKVKDNQQTKGILRQWYKAHVYPNKQKLKSTSQISKPSSLTTSNIPSIQVNKDQKIPSSIFNRKKINLFTNQKLRNCKSTVNQRSIFKKNLNFQQQKEHNSKSTMKLAKLIVRVQPFWDKVRIKI